MKIEFGSDPEIQYCRERIPEPGREPNPRYRALKRPKIPDFKDYQTLTYSADEWTKLSYVEFERILVSEQGMTYWAWRCLDDGMVYF